MDSLNLHELVQNVEVVAMEECAELVQAISKIVRYGNEPEYYDNLQEEIADVKLMICLLQSKYKIPEIEIIERISYKEQRLKKRAKLNNGKAR